MEYYILWLKSNICSAIIISHKKIFAIIFISVGETPTSINGETKHIRLNGGDNPPTEIKPDRGLQECAEEDVSKADAHSTARTLERS